ncbi:hypothetical protein JYK02_08005 [Corallococcus macrosporus]|uniref:KAP NTPase domain-containing protein n=1 Tax=Corallococcus macrosporus TaxID=35 RepID=A0ABS3D709_9BACT|nr:P-loop NTPase fold protein [Corallococcus macrosporus]MBN8227449.1 hypothetical protein [Corallococcus macrosporus]
MNTARHRNAIIKRWFEIVAFSLPAGATALFALHLAPNCKDFTDFAEWAVVPALTLLIGFGLLWGRKRAPAWSGLRHFWRYPPSWFAALLGFIWLIFFLAVSPSATQALQCPGLSSDEIRSFLSTSWMNILVLIGFITMLLIVAALLASTIGTSDEQSRVAALLGLSPPASSTTQPAAPTPPTIDFSKLRIWVQNDTPINHPDLDTFSRNPIAKRISNKIKARTEKALTIALIGELGSGKTSIYNLVLHELNDAGLLGQSVAVVRISLWPFDTVDAAIHGILSSLTEELGRHVNTTPIAGLPDEYISTIENAGVGWAKLFRRNRPPAAILSDFDEVTAALDMHFVLWIEDLERFAGSTSTTHPPEVERLAPLRSLLHSISEATSIQVVFASTLLSARFDIEKIARIVEPLPTIEPKFIWKTLSAFMKGCLATESYIDPVSLSTREHLRGNSTADWFDWAPYVPQDMFTLPVALATICNNPRKIKYGLRQCLDVWDKLRGEIDFDDLFSVSLLRASEPDVFALIVDNIDEIRSESRPRESRSNTEAKSNFEIQFNALWGSAASPKRAAIEEILDFIFPNWREPGTQQVAKIKPQGLSVRSHRDYWKRYLSQDSLSTEEKDQPILKDIVLWKSHFSNELVSRLLKASQLDTVRAFAGLLLGTHELTKLLDATVRAELRRSPVEWGNRYPPSVIAIWHLLLDKENELLPSTLKELIKLTTSVNLQLTSTLLYFFLTKDGSGPELVPQAQAEEIKASFIEILCDSFISKDPKHLADALRGAEPATLLINCWGLGRVRQKKFEGLPFAHWRPFSDALIEAAELAPEAVLPQINQFIVDRADQIRWDEGVFREVATYTLNSERANRLFNMNRLFEITLKVSSPDIFPAESIPAYEAILRHAQNLQGKRSGKS